MQLMALILVALVSAAAGFLLAAALASGAKEDAFRAGYRAGMHAACVALSKIAAGVTVRESGQPDEERALWSPAEQLDDARGG